MEKRFSSLLVAASVVATTFTGPVLAAAQEVGPFGNRPAEIDLTETYQPPRVYVESIDNTEQKGQTLKGTLHLFNAEETTISDLSYRVEIYDAASVQTNAPVLYAYVAGDRIGPMITKEERAVDFKLSIPNLPAGDYALRFQLMHSNGRKLGWGDYTWTSHLSSDRVDALATGITLPEFNNTVVEPLTGPNVDPSSTFSLEATVVNPLDHEVTVKPMLRVYPFDVSRGEPDVITFDALTLAAHEQHTLSLQITATEHAGVSIGHLTFEQDGVSLSPIAAYRWVVRGQSADIVATKIQSVGTKAGDTTDIQLDYVGPADAETHLTGSLLVTVNDVEGTVGGVQVEGIALTDALNSSMVRVPMNRGFESVPVVNVTILDANGLTLAHSTAEIPASSANVTFSLSGSVMRVAGDVIPYALLFLALALLALAARSIVRSTELRKLTAKAMAFCLLMMQVGSFSSFAYAQAGMIEPVDLSITGNGSVPVAEMVAPQAQGAQGIIVIRADSSTKWFSNFGTRPIVELFVNRPIHDAPVGTYQCDGTIPFEYRVSYVVCYNVPSVVRVIGRVDANGGKHSNIVGNQQSNWKEVYDEKINRNNSSDLRCTTGFDGQWCFREDGDSTSINLRSLHITAQNTTFQVAAKRSYDAARYVPTDVISATEPDLLGGSSTLVNIWLNCRDAAVCGNGNIEQGEECDDGNNSSNDACTNQCKNAFCGDGIVRTGSEQCDDGNQNNNDGCTNLCTLPVQNTDVTIAKTADQTVVTKGGAATFRIQGQNISQTIAQNVVITDSIPSQLTIVSAPGCTITGQNLRCTAGTLSPGQTTSTFVVNTTVHNDASITNGMIIVNSAHIATDTPESNYGNNDDTAQVSVQVIQTPKADMLIQKSGPTQVNQGGTLNYSLIVKNNGPDTAQNVVVTDVIPAGLTYIDNQSDSRCNQNGNSVVCQLGSMTNQQQTSLGIVFQSSVNTACAVLTNIASVSTSTQDDFVGNNQSSFQTQVNCPQPAAADVSVQKSGPTQVNQGGTLNYSLIVKNNGPDTAQNVVVTDPIPAGLTYLDNQSDSRCNQVGNNVVCQLGSMTNQQQTSLGIVFQSSVNTACAVLTNIASVSTTTNDAFTGNNQSSFQTQVNCPQPAAADVSVQKSGPAQIDRGYNISYSLVVKNNGPDTAQNVVVTDVVPAGIAFIENTSDSRCNQSGNNVVCQLGSMTNQQQITLGLIFATSTTVTQCGTLTNTASVTTTTNDAFAGNNQSSFQTQINCQNPNADVQIQKSGPTQIDQGDRLLYTIIAKNNGPATANNVVVTDAIPAGLTYVTGGSDSRCNQNGNNIVCQLGTMSNQQQISLTLAFQTSANTSCGNLTNTASIATSSQDTNLNNNQSSFTTQVQCQNTPPQCSDGIDNDGDGKVDMQDPDCSNPNDNDESNPNDCVIVHTSVHSLGANRSYAELPPLSQLPAHTVIRNIDLFNHVLDASDLSNADIVVYGDRNKDSGPWRDLTNSELSLFANAFNSGVDFTFAADNPTLDEASPGTRQILNTIQSAMRYLDTYVGEQHGTHTPNTTLYPFLAGKIFDFSTDGLKSPGDLTASGNAQCVFSLNGRCHAAWMPASGNRGFVFAEGNAGVGSSQYLKNFINMACPATPKADLQIVKSGPTQIDRGSTVNYSLSVKNNGPDIAQNVVVTDVIPTGLTYVDNQSDSRCNQNGNSVVCQLNSMNNQQQTSIALVFQSSSTMSCGTMTNTASVSTTTQDTGNSNNQSSFQTLVNCPVQTTDISISKTANMTTVQRGDSVTYTLTVTNNGPAAADNVTINDAATVFLDNPVIVNGPCTLNGSDVRCTFGTMSVGQSVSVQIRYTINQSATIGQNIVNVATASTTTQDTNMGNNQASATVTVAGPSVGCINITKQAFDPFGRGISVVPQFQFQLDGGQTVVNNSNGNAVFNNVAAGTHTVTEVIPAGWTQFNVTPANGTVTVTAGTSCAQVTFSNQQNSVSSSSSSSSNSSSSSSSSQNNTGCVDVLKEAFDVFGQKITVTPQFQFQLDGGQTVMNNTDGRATFNNVPAGTHTVTEVIPSGWNQFLVTPLNGTVNVTAGNSCAGVVFKNQQTSSSSSSSSSSGAPDMTISKSGPSTAQQNGQVTYTVVVTNSGNATAQNVEMRDVIPSGMTYVSALGNNITCSLNGSTVNCQLGNMNAGQSQTVTITVTVNGSVACNAVLINVASVTTTSPETNTSNNNSTQVQTTVQCNNTQTGCIDITKTAYDSNGNQIYSVPSFLYTMDGSRTVNNDSNGRARFDNVPVGTHTVIETVGSGWNLESVSPNNGAVNVVAGGSCAQVQFRNRQTTNSNYDFTITKTDGESEVDQGDELTYTIRVRNNSSQTVNNVTVTDTLPDEVDFNSCTKSCSHSGRFITWSDQTFGAYEEREYEVDVDVDDNADGTITNEARVQVGSFSRTATDRTDINDNNDQDVEADLTKVASVSEVFPGGVVEYTLTLRNTGDADLKDVTVEDILPAEMIIVDDDDADERNGSRLTWDVGDLDSGDTWTATYRTTVSTSAFPGQILSNRACADDEDNNLDQCETVTVAVIGNLPQTGIFGGLTASSIKLRPIKLGGSSPLSSAGSAGAPLAAWVSIVGLGMGLGAGVGRKFLIGF